MQESPSSQTETGTSTELTGGAGYTYEDTVVAYFLAALLRAESAAGVGGTVVRVAVQQRSAGQPLDDVIVDARDGVGDRRLSLQVKRSLTISAAASNEDLRQIIADSRATRADPAFRVERDSYGFVAQAVAAGPLRNFRRIMELARNSTNAAEFVQRFEGQGATSQDQRDLRRELHTLVAETDEAEWDFYRHFVAPDVSGLELGGALVAAIESNLGATLADGQARNGAGLFAALCRTARVGAGAGKIWTRPALLHALAKDFRLRGIPAYADDLDTIGRLTSTAFAEISDQVGAHHVDRSATVQKVFALIETHRLVNITGLPGCGKSAILRNVAQRMAVAGPVLFLKSDLLAGADWQGFVVAKGLAHHNPIELLAEIGSTGNSILFIDGIDRIPPSQRSIVKDVMRAIITEPALERWRVLVTSRNQGMEPFRVWVPPALHAEGGIGDVSVDAFDDDEAERLAAQVPSLRPLLFGAQGVRSIARRPFFAAVLAGRNAQGTEATNARSETDLISYWWGGGGYDARGEALLMRQRALLDLAQVGARSLGKSVRAISVKPETAARMAELIEDGIVRTPDEHATYSFAHDIFFEWAFFRLLFALGADWIGALGDAGQPPLLGRVVGLLAQRAIHSGQSWNDGLAQLNNTELRPQWRRAWVTGPAARPDFAASKDRYTKVMEADDWRLLRSFLVWFQAEQTIPNPLVLENTHVPFDGAMRVRLADLAGWPGDHLTWARVIIWLISTVDRVPVRLLPLILELFKVWQNQFAAAPNLVSMAILNVCARWLEEIDTVSYPEKLSFERGRWDALRGDALSNFESGLRQMILLAMRAYPEHGDVVLDRAIANGRLRRHAYEAIIGLSPTISAISPQKLADLARAELLETLPKDVIAEGEARRRRRSERLANIRAKPEAERTKEEKLALQQVSLSAFGGRQDHDLDDLGINRYHHAYFPTSPLHEPFASLFRSNPDIARALVRDMGNHATTAWRQIHELAPRRYGTPIPLDLDFPWGRQRFWGDWNSYNWVGEHPAPQPLACAFMALAHWTHKELERGAPVDGLIHQVVEGQESWAVLGLSAALALEKGHVSATVLPIAAAQRLWEMDIARAAQEPTRGIDLFGFGTLNRLTGDKEAAMNYLKTRSSRHRNIRDLAPLFAHAADATLRDAFRERLAQFPAELPFYYEEERENAGREAHLRENAEQWAGLGNAANYHATPTQNGEHVIVSYQSPTPLSQATQQRLEEVVISLNEYSVADWVSKSLKTGTPDSSGTLEANLAFVRARDTPAMFEHLTPSGDGMTQSAISGVAASVLLLGSPSREEEAWAWEVMRRVEGMQEERDLGGGNIPWHPAFHLIAVLHAGLRQPKAEREAAPRLFGLCLHPNTRVARTALATLLNGPDIALAWSATVLASDFWHHHQPILGRNGERDYTAQHKADAAAVARAKARLAHGEMSVPGPLPSPWPPRPPHGRSILDEDDFGDDLREPTITFDYHAAEEVTRALPVDGLCSSEVYRTPFLTYVRELVAWTADRFNPADEDPTPGRLRRELADLNMWPGRLGELLARIGPYVDIEAMRRDYLGPFLEPDDENGLGVTSEFAESLVCRHVLDAAAVTPQTVALLQLCLDQVLADPVFRRASYRAGEVHGLDLPRLIKALLSVPLDQPAPGAARFANGDWTDLPVVVPLVEQLVAEVGWAPYVMETFLTLAERAGLYYPIDAFAALMTRVLTGLGDNADGWVGTMIPARIAGTIQVLADSNYPLAAARATSLLRLLDMLIDLGDRRSAALEGSETFRSAQTG